MADSIMDISDAIHQGSARQVSWQESMKRAIRGSLHLSLALQLYPDEVEWLNQPSFPVFVPLEYLSRIEKGNPKDPLLAQIAPSLAEKTSPVGFSEDPVGDSRFEAAPGLIHKYHGRVLLITSGACGIHCRYCFRRHYPYQTAPKSMQQWQSSLAYIESDITISEVILSGGDPLTIVDPLLAELVQRIEQISHVKRLRIHTRMPVVIPQRVTSELCNILQQSRLAKWVVLHINHAHEIDGHVADAVRRLRQSGATVLNQAVLLKGVNDHGPTLVDLCERLVDNQITPYYLNHLDPVKGAAHFNVPIERGLELMQYLQEMLPGYAVPRYVQDATNHDLDKAPKSKLPLS
ncbi:MAG: EF-P beta-lysylation protein EpmB [Pirellula sp.]|jgi:EF-P beta-lysylation protein EpmB|nr:EF-P beta-lysylation protein EpmB [Pirellula sp.]